MAQRRLGEQAPAKPHRMDAVLHVILQGKLHVMHVGHVASAHDSRDLSAPARRNNTKRWQRIPLRDDRESSSGDNKESASEMTENFHQEHDEGASHCIVVWVSVQAL